MIEHRTSRTRILALGAALAATLVSSVAAAPVAAAQAPEPAAPAGVTCGATWPAYPYVDTPMKGSCAILGSPGLVEHFSWSAGPGNASLQIQGFDQAGKPRWYDCGAFGGDCAVPWGNVASEVHMRARAVTRSTVVDVHY